jgi:hypothetical protein
VRAVASKLSCQAVAEIVPAAPADGSKTPPIHFQSGISSSLLLCQMEQTPEVRMLTTPAPVVFSVRRSSIFGQSSISGRAHMPVRCVTYSEFEIADDSVRCPAGVLARSGKGSRF